MKTEIWKKHPDIENLEVSSFGRVRSLDKVVPSGKHMQFVKGHILKQHSDKGGYLKIGFHVNGKSITKSVHRLIAETFLPNPNGFPMVNHRDCDRKNNHVENLEWCTAKYNCQYREKYGVSRTEAVGHPLFSINLATLEVSRFRSQHEAERALGVSNGNINAVIKGKRNQTGGFWFVNDDNKATDAIKNKLHKIRKGW